MIQLILDEGDTLREEGECIGVFGVVELNLKVRECLFSCGNDR